jgi:hypothetical protein
MATHASIARIRIGNPPSPPVGGERSRAEPKQRHSSWAPEWAISDHEALGLLKIAIDASIAALSPSMSQKLTFQKFAAGGAISLKKPRLAWHSAKQLQVRVSERFTRMPAAKRQKMIKVLAKQRFI